jgi:site-specific DNA-methyltransferase (adenine-specific)
MPKRSECLQSQPTLLEVPLRGTLHEIQPDAGLQLHYEHPHGRLFCGDSFEWLASLEPESVDLFVADPPYNLKKAEWDSFESHEEYVEWSRRWIELASGALKPKGTLYVCGFSEILADVKVASVKYFAGCRWLVWHYKNKANLGKDWGRSHESILHFRKRAEFTMNYDSVRIPYGAHTLKYPAHPQATTSQYGRGKEREEDWTPNPDGAKPKDVFDIPTTCNGMGEKTPHPTQKPEELIRKLVLASSNAGETVADPFSGSGTTVVVAEQLGRRWMGCDLQPQYNLWAVERLQRVVPKTPEEWMELDRKTAERRESIR